MREKLCRELGLAAESMPYPWRAFRGAVCDEFSQYLMRRAHYMEHQRQMQLLRKSYMLSENIELQFGRCSAEGVEPGFAYGYHLR